MRGLRDRQLARQACLYLLQVALRLRIGSQLLLDGFDLALEPTHHLMEVVRLLKHTLDQFDVGCSSGKDLVDPASDGLHDEKMLVVFHHVRADLLFRDCIQ